MLQKDPVIIGAWFKLIEETIAKYSVYKDNIHNFNKTGFQIGLRELVKVVTTSKRCYALLSVQPSNYKQITLITSINIIGQSILPFFIFKVKHYNKAQYVNNLKDQRIRVSKNGQTINELSLTQLKHFIYYIEAATIGSYQLLIINSYKSYQLLKFQNLCKESKTITLYILLYASYILQLLNVSYFTLLKQAYKKEIKSLVDSYITYIDKKAFLVTF